MKAFGSSLGMLSLAGFAMVAAMFTTNSAAEAAAQKSGPIPVRLADRPLAFEPNLGQAALGVQYVTRADHYTALLQGNRATFLLRTAHPASHLPLRNDSSSWVTPESMAMTFVGARRKPVSRAEEQLQGRSNYFIGHSKEQWRLGVPHYGAVTYKALYPGIDVRYHGTQQALEYDFVVAPGADPQLIRIAFDGQSGLTLTPDGDLLIAAKDAQIILKKPVAYQVRNGQQVAVDSTFARLPNDQIGLTVADYDRAAELVIDPTVTYASYLGGTDDEGIFGIGFDREGNIYVSGETSSVDFPTRNAAQPRVGGNYDAFVSKFDRTGSRLIYSTYLGGSSYDHAVGIAVNDDGEAYVAGLTQSTDFPVAHALQSTLSGPGDAFVAKLDREGSALLFSTYLGGSAFSQAAGLTIDSHGDVYVAGQTSAVDFPTTPHAFQIEVRRGRADGVLQRKCICRQVASLGFKASLFDLPGW